MTKRRMSSFTEGWIDYKVVVGGEHIYKLSVNLTSDEHFFISVNEYDYNKCFIRLAVIKSFIVKSYILL